MQCDFQQRSLLEKRWFTFTNDGLHVRYKKLIKTHEYELKYEDIGTKVTQTKSGRRGWLVTTILFAVIAVGVLIGRLSGADVEKGAETLYLTFSVISGAIYYFTIKRSCYLVKTNNTNAIGFLNNKPSKEELEKFLDETKLRRREFLLERYGQLNKNLSYEYQYNNLDWLLNNDVISKGEFESKVAQLDLSMPSTTTVIGFTLGRDN